MHSVVENVRHMIYILTSAHSNLAEHLVQSSSLITSRKMDNTNLRNQADKAISDVQKTKDLGRDRYFKLTLRSQNNEIEESSKTKVSDIGGIMQAPLGTSNSEVCCSSNDIDKN